MTFTPFVDPKTGNKIAKRLERARGVAGATSPSETNETRGGAAEEGAAAERPDQPEEGASSSSDWRLKGTTIEKARARVAHAHRMWRLHSLQNPCSFPHAKRRRSPPRNPLHSSRSSTSSGAPPGLTRRRCPTSSDG